jgi:hypothetical protein
MAVLKLGKSGKSIMVVDDDGRTFITSVEHIRRLCDGLFSTGFLVLTRLPNGVASNRFPPSPTWNPNTGSVSICEVPDVDSSLTTTNDALSVKRRSEKEIKDVLL